MNPGKIRSVFNRLLLDKIIFHYFLYFKKVFKREIFEFRLGYQFHNFILKVLRGTDSKIIGRIHSDYYVQFNGFKFIARTPQVYYNLLRYGEYEPVSSFLFNRFVKKGMTVLDIGGNLGYFSILSSKLVGNKGMVYSFEPDPINYKYFRKNLEINSIRNVHIINKCVSDQDGVVQFFIHPKIHSCHSILNLDSHKSIQVEAIKLDDFFIGHEGNIPFVKMDIEGAELKALCGMKSLLHDKIKFLLTELNMRRLKFLKKTPKDFISILDKYFTKYYVIVDDKDLNLKLYTDSRKLVKYLNSLKIDNLNLFCIK